VQIETIRDEHVYNNMKCVSWFPWFQSKKCTFLFLNNVSKGTQLSSHLVKLSS
jgi:hypothetical protein